MIRMIELSEKEFEEYLKELARIKKLAFHGKELLNKLLEIEGFYVFDDLHDLYDYFNDDFLAAFDLQDDTILQFVDIESWINNYIHSGLMDILKVDFPNNPRFIYVIADHGQIMDDELKELDGGVRNEKRNV